MVFYSGAHPTRNSRLLRNHSGTSNRGKGIGFAPNRNRTIPASQHRRDLVTETLSSRILKNRKIVKIVDSLVRRDPNTALPVLKYRLDRVTGQTIFAPKVFN